MKKTGIITQKTNARLTTKKWVLHSLLLAGLLFSTSSETVAREMFYQAVDSLVFDTTLTGLSLSSQAWGDFDNDNDLDLIVVGYTGSVASSNLYISDGSGGLTLSAESSTFTDVYDGDVAWADYDNDGDLDLAISGYTGSAAVTELYDNNGDGTFTLNSSASTSFINVYFSSLAWADYDNDGDLDLTVIGTTNGVDTGHRTRLYDNNGDGSFTNSSASSTFTDVYDGDVAWADYDNDGDLDLALTGTTNGISAGRKTFLYDNNGDGSFTNSSASSTLIDMFASSLAWGDYDDDGDIDLVVLGRGAGSVVSADLYDNNGDGSFTNSSASSTFTDVYDGDVAWADHDFDGDIDLAISGTTDGSDSEASTKLYTNNGDGSFSNSAISDSLSGMHGGSLTWADFDNDGTLDLAISGADTAGFPMYVLYRNVPLSNGSGPSRPSGLSKVVSTSSLTLSWVASTDSEGGPIAYNVYLENVDSSTTVTPSMSDQSNGYRKVTTAGNAGLTNNYTLNTTNLIEGGSYEWGVQAIDGSGKTSSFRTQSFTYSGIFEEVTDISTVFENVSNSSVAWGDYDNDGDLDIVVSGSPSSGTSTDLYDNNGDGSFTNSSASSTLTDITSGSVAWGDYDADGDLDLIASGSTNGSSSSRSTNLYTNNGDGSFTNSSASSTFTNLIYSSLAWGDYDNDGDLDVAISGFTGSAASTKLYENNGDGSFTNSSESSSLADVILGSLAWGDYDNDGDLDLVVSGATYSGSITTGTPKTNLYNNNGDGTFTNSAASSTLSGVKNSSLAWGDYDNDGDLDLVVSGASNVGASSRDTKLYRNNGDGSFTNSPASSTLTGVQNSSLTWGDYDNDGDLDLAIVGTTNNLASGRSTNLYENNGDGSFTNSTVSDILTDVYRGAIAFGDYNTDGALDLIVIGRTTTNGRSSKMYTNITALTGSAPSIPVTSNTRVVPDSLTLSWSVSSDTEGGPISYNVYIENTDSSITVTPSMSDQGNGYRKVRTIGNAGLSTSYTLDATQFIEGEDYTWGVQAIDGSNQASAFVTHSFVYSETFQNTLDINNVLSKVEKSSLAWGDYDNDGDLDVVVSGETASGASTHLYTNGGDGSFTISAASDSLSDVYDGSLAWGDYDGDGDLDLAASGYTGSEISTNLYTNKGDGTFETHSSASSTLPNVHLGSLAWGDYDNDGDLDLVISGASNVEVSSRITRLYRNNGDGSFTNSSASSTLTEVQHSSLAWSDFDNDGDLDLVVSGTNNGLNSGKSTRLYINNGDGSFTNSSASSTLTDVYFSSLAWGDYDDDGDLDLIISGSTSDNAADGVTNVYTNNGDGSLSLNGAASDSLVNVFKGALAWSDYDNDGDLDIVVSGQDNAGSAITNIYDSDGGVTPVFTLSSVSEVLTNLYGGSIDIGDYNKDGALDLVVTGNTGAERNTSVFTSFIETAGSAPGVPSNLMSSFDADTVSFSWDSVTDTEGGAINYNVQVTQNAVGTSAAPSQSNLSDGFHRVTSLGNAGLRTSFKLHTSALPNGPYSWTVQAIDGSKKTSTFASLLSFSIGGFFAKQDTSAVSLTDTTYLFALGELDVMNVYADSSLTLSLVNSFSDTLFVDQNNNRRFDASEPILDATGFDINLLDSDTLALKSATSGTQTIKVKLANSFASDSLEIEVVQLEATPQISGTSGEGGWYLLANPFETTVGELFSNVWTQGAGNSNVPEGVANLYTFSQDSSVYVPITTDLDTTVLAAGTGILAFLYADDDNNSGTPLVNGGWPKTLNNFGNPFGQSVAIPIANVDGDNSGGTSGSEGFVLLGNPYGLDLSIDSVTATIKRLDPFANSYIYRWNAVAKRYEISTAGSVQPYESFFVRTINSGLSDTLKFDYGDLHVASQGKQRVEQHFSLELTHAQEGLESTFSIRTGENALEGIDSYDGYYLGSYARTYANLYTLVGDQYLAINNLPEVLDEEISIPIYMDATIGGEFKLNWDKNLLPEDWTVTLLETATGEVIDVRAVKEYAFDTASKSKTALKPGPVLGVAQKSKAATLEPTFILTIQSGHSVSNEEDLGIPREVELHQNFPNPFNPSSVIRFGVPSAAKVQLEVFDILGRKVLTLVDNETKSPGWYNIHFNAGNLASGMYLYRLVIGSKVLTKKMTLVK